MMKPTDFDATISDELALYQGTPPGQESSIFKVAHFAWYQAGKMGKAGTSPKSYAETEDSGAKHQGWDG